MMLIHHLTNFLKIGFPFLELPKDFFQIQEEIERQKAALLEKGKRKETAEISGIEFRKKVLMIILCQNV